MFSVEEILKVTGGILVSGERTKEVSGISIDSRTIKKNELFIAIKGNRFDGHNFIRDAFKNGASGSIFEKGHMSPIAAFVFERRLRIKVKDTLKALGDIASYHREGFDIPVIGITGSNGKTTVKEMVWQILNKKHNVLKNRGTENNLVGLPLGLLGLSKEHTACVLEIGANRWGEIARLTEILKPTIGVITNIGPSHLEFLQDREGVLKAKSEMVDKLKKSDRLFLNGDDEMLSRIKTPCRTIRFGLNRYNDFYASRIEYGSKRISFLLNGRHQFRLNMLGSHNVYNALAAIAVSSFLGVDIPSIRDAIFEFRLPNMRMEFKAINGISVINDTYNSNPLSLGCAIRALANFKTEGKRILVSGDMLELGRKSRMFHSLAGRMIARSSIDRLVAVGSSSRYTAQAAKGAGMKGHNLFSCGDTNEAAGILRRLAKPGDVVLIKGSRAMSMESIIENLRE